MTGRWRTATGNWCGHLRAMKMSRRKISTVQVRFLRRLVSLGRLAVVHVRDPKRYLFDIALFGPETELELTKMAHRHGGTVRQWLLRISDIVIDRERAKMERRRTIGRRHTDGVREKRKKATSYKWVSYG